MNPGNVKHTNHGLAFTQLGVSLSVRGIKGTTGGRTGPGFLGKGPLPVVNGCDPTEIRYSTVSKGMEV